VAHGHEVPRADGVAHACPGRCSWWGGHHRDERQRSGKSTGAGAHQTGGAAWRRWKTAMWLGSGAAEGSHAVDDGSQQGKVVTELA
jgi:hypothetical protein